MSSCRYPRCMPADPANTRGNREAVVAGLSAAEALAYGRRAAERRMRWHILWSFAMALPIGWSTLA